MSWKPDGYTSASPYLLVRDAERALAFGQAVFGAERLRVIPRPGGGIMHAEMRIDDSVVMMGETADAPDAHVHVYVPDAGATFRRALEAGGTVVRDLESAGDGDLRGGIADGNGTVWWIGTQE